MAAFLWVGFQTERRCGAKEIFPLFFFPTDAEFSIPTSCPHSRNFHKVTRFAYMQITLGALPAGDGAGP